jgi:hypothetical protein
MFTGACHCSISKTRWIPSSLYEISLNVLCVLHVVSLLHGFLFCSMHVSWVWYIPLEHMWAAVHSRYSSCLQVWIPSPARVNNFHFSVSSRPALGPPNLLSNSYWGPLSPGVKQKEREADYSPPTSAKAKKSCIHTCTPPYVFMAYCLIR